VCTIEMVAFFFPITDGNISGCFMRSGFDIIRLNMSYCLT